MAAFVAGVDRLLSRGHGLFPASGGDVGVDASGEPVPAPPAGTGGLSEGAAAAGGEYQRSRTAISALDADSSQAAGQGSEVGQQGRAGAGLVRDTARVQASAIAPASSSPAGMKLLVSTMDERLSEMQRQVDTTKAQNQLLATRLRQVAAAYQGAALSGGMGGRSPLAGVGGMPMMGGFPGGGGLSGLSGMAGLPGTLMGRMHANNARFAGAAHGGLAAGAAGIPEGRIPLSQVSFEGKGVWPGGRAAVGHYLEEALDRMGITDPRARANWIAGMTTIAEHEATCRADAINLSDTNAHGPRQVDGGPLHATRGPWQVMPDTFAAHHQPGTSNHIWDPVASACASMNYQMSRYHVARDAHNLRALVAQANPGVHHGY